MYTPYVWRYVLGVGLGVEKEGLHNFLTLKLDEAS